jgi:cytochrome c-type biogenesis protein CcmF
MITARAPGHQPAESANEPRRRHGAAGRRLPLQWEMAPGVQRMIAELGHYALILALGLALIQGTMPIVGTRTNDAVLMSMATATALAQFAFVAMAFTALAVCYVISDFSVLNVFENSNSQMPFIYRLTSIWGNHEGSMMLWVSILTFFGALVALFGNNLPAVLKANALVVQAWIAAAFYLFILMTSNPFVRLPQAPFEGQDLNPILQDPGLAFHPPLLYLGYVGFSIAFSFAIAALLEGRIDAAWARWVRPWVLAAWMCLTLGIAGGSYWAYYTLGWGGFWFWDPVENASLMPWLAGTALLHSAVVMEKRGALKVWTILLAILAFSLSLIGTFLVRSGVLTSVHTFATDPMRGVFILAILVVFIGGALALYGWRAPLLKQGGLFAPISREGALVFNNLFLTTACASVFIGTLYPLALEALTGAKISVGPPFFNATFGPLFIALMMVVPFGPLMGWKRGDLLGAAQRLFAAAILAVLAMSAAFALEQGGPTLAPFGAGVAVFVMAGAVIDIAERTLVLRVPFRAALRRAIGLPRSAWGTAFAHFGLGVTLLGIVAATAWGAERIAEMKIGDNLDIAHYRVTFTGAFSRQGPNYRDMVGRFVVRRMNGDLIGVMEPSRRSFPSRNMTTTEAALMTRGVSQLYLSLGDPTQDGNVAVRLYFKPQVLLIWFGAAIMVAGGALSLSDRRLRVGAPQPAKAKAALRPAG